MAYEECLLEVQKIAGRDLNPEEKKQVSDTVSRLIKRLEKEGRADNLTERVMKAVDEMMEDVKISALIEKRNAALNLRAKLAGTDYLTTNWFDDPKEGLRAFFGNSLVDRQGSKNGIATHIEATEDSYVSGLLGKLAKKDLVKIASSGDFDFHIWKAMHELSSAEPNLKGIPDEVLEIAKIFNEVNEHSRVNANKSGSWIKKLPGYVIRRTHDTLKIKKAGGADIPINSPKHQQAWSSWVGDNLDWEKSMPDVAFEDRAGVLGKMFREFSNGVHIKFKDGESNGLKGAFNMGKALSHERILHFKSPEAEFEYHKRFGASDTLMEGMVNGLSRMGRDTAIMKKMGPNAKANLDGIVENLMKKYSKEGREDLAAILQKEYSSFGEDMWKQVSGETAIPVNETFAAWSQVTRNVQTLGKLGGAILSAPTDMVFYASTMRHYGARTQGSFFSGMMEAAENVVGGFTKGISPEQIQTAAENGILLDAVANPIGKVTGDTPMPGRTSKWVQQMFKYNGLSKWQDSIRLGATVATGFRHASMAGKAFNDLDAGVQALFRQFEISPKDWDAIRSSTPKVDGEGRAFFTGESVRGFSDEVAAKNIGKKTKNSISKYKEDLGDKYRNLMAEVAHMATSEPGAMERNYMFGSSQTGTAKGEIARHFWMYKAFTVSVMRKHLGRELLGYGAERLPIHKALFNAVKDPTGSSMGGLANMVVYGTLMGYGSMAMKDIAKGKEPRVPKDFDEFKKVFAASAMQSGSFGIYGDFLFGEMKSRMGHGPLETFLGPTWGTATDVVDLYSRFKNGDDVAAKTFQFALNNTPVVNTAFNLFYTRAALDYLIVHRMQEFMNPGYLRRMEGKLKQEKQQEYLVPPSSVIPYGGGF